MTADPARKSDSALIERRSERRPSAKRMKHEHHLTRTRWVTAAANQRGPWSVVGNYLVEAERTSGSG
jgi:hypothetical protein